MKKDKVRVFTAMQLMELTGIGFQSLKKVAKVENEDFFFINFDKISILAIRNLKAEIGDKHIGRKLYLEQAFWKCVFAGKNEFSHYARMFIASKIMPSITKHGFFNSKKTQFEGINNLGEEIGETKSYFDEEDEHSFNQSLQVVMEKKQTMLLSSELFFNLNRSQFLESFKTKSFIASWKKK